jgi:hypothetical protein
MQWWHDMVKWHPILLGSGVTGVSIWIFNAFVSSMPELPPTAGFWTKTWYRFAHLVASRLDKFEMTGGGK